MATTMAHDSNSNSLLFLVAPHVREYGATHEVLHVDYLLKPAPSATNRNAQQQPGQDKFT